jgi:hypothetical protein
VSNIVFIMKDGTRREFKHEGRPGGSYTKELKFEGAFAVVIDEWYRRIAIPAVDIAEIQETPNR